MPRGYRCIVLAAFGWLILGAQFPYPRAGDGQTQSSAPLLQAQHKPVAAEPSRDQAKPTEPSAARSVRQLPRTPKYEPRCDSPKDREESDLCAQWASVAAARRANVIGVEANHAARDANAVSADTLYWTRAGFVAVLATLLATAWAAWAAAKAATIAGKSLTLFQDSESGILVPSIDVTNGGAAHHVTLVNRGRTPVTLIHADFNVLDNPPVGPISTFVHQFPSDLLIAADKPYDFGQFRFNTDRRKTYSSAAPSIKMSSGAPTSA
jgi:hypothetical protein